MKTQKEIYQALLDGKTLVNKCDGFTIKLRNNGNLDSDIYFKYPEQWSIYNEWKMEPAEWSVMNTGVIGRNIPEEVTLTQKFGMRYHTKKAAKNAIKEMKEANLLRYWASVIDPEWKADWEDLIPKKWYIEHDTHLDKYYKNFRCSHPTLGTVYMSEEAATKICEALNDGELTLN